MLFFLPHWRESRRTSARILERRLQIGPSSRRCKLGRGKRTYYSPEEQRKKVSAMQLDEPRCHGWADAKVWRPRQQPISRLGYFTQRVPETRERRNSVRRNLRTLVGKPCLQSVQGDPK
jgi:hypothetical protein